MNLPDDLKYTKEHEWVRVEGDAATVGITDHAQEQLGDVVFVELPEVDSTLTAGDAFGTVESVKAVSDLFAPLTGKVTELNPTLEDAPETVNQDPFGEGWMVKMSVANAAQLEDLLSADDYKKLLEEA